MTQSKLNFIGSMFFLKFSVLMLIVLSLTVAKPTAIAAHKATQKICSVVMQADECIKHC